MNVIEDLDGKDLKNKSYKFVLCCPVGKYTINFIRAPNSIVATGLAISYFKKDYPLYPVDILSIERTDFKFSKDENDEWHYNFDGCF